MTCSILGGHPRFLEQQGAILNRSKCVSKVLVSFEFFPDLSLFIAFLCETLGNEKEYLSRVSVIYVIIYK